MHRHRNNATGIDPGRSSTTSSISASSGSTSQQDRHLSLSAESAQRTPTRSDDFQDRLGTVVGSTTVDRVIPPPAESRNNFTNKHVCLPGLEPQLSDICPAQLSNAGPWHDDTKLCNGLDTICDPSAIHICKPFWTGMKDARSSACQFGEENIIHEDSFGTIVAHVRPSCCIEYGKKAQCTREDCFYGHDKPAIRHTTFDLWKAAR